MEGLMELGWIERVALPSPEKKDSQILWEWLVENAHSDYIEFAEDGFVSAAWDDELRERLGKELVQRLRSERDIDLMLALGTRAGQDLATDEHSVPTIVITSTDPIKSGIVKSADDSGLDHVHARVDPHRNERQVTIFHELVAFNRLGVAYEDSVAGRNYAAIDIIRSLGKDRGFEIIECHTLSDIPDRTVAGESVTECFEALSKTSDAIYVTMQGGVNRDTIPQLVKIANNYRIPTLSQIGEKGVQAGLLVSVSSFYASKKSGRFFASVIARIFNGARPRQLSQVLEESPNISLNLKTAEIVGLYLKADILAAADNVFLTIGQPE
jgi:ABC-type uncharacterized transport system substrate-binding protein